MSESSGAQGASTLVLRISVPAGAEYEAIVKELVAKVAAYLGDTDPDGRAAAAGVANGEDTIFEFRQTAEALLIRARGAGRSADAWRPLPFRT
jgi:hypothetical protein